LFKNRHDRKFRSLTASVSRWYKLDWHQWRSDRGAGRTGRHLLGAAKGRKTPKIKKKSPENSDCFICVCVQEKQSVTASVYLSSAIPSGTAL